MVHEVPTVLSARTRNIPVAGILITTSCDPCASTTSGVTVCAPMERAATTKNMRTSGGIGSYNWSEAEFLPRPDTPPRCERRVHLGLALQMEARGGIQSTLKGETKHERSDLERQTRTHASEGGTRTSRPRSAK